MDRETKKEETWELVELKWAKSKDNLEGVSISKYLLRSRPRQRVIGRMAEINTSLHFDPAAAANSAETHKKS